MGRRTTSSTKGGKYMNPTDQARKEARKRELKKNKKQRQIVRQAVLKGKNPTEIFEELEKIDDIEYDVYNPPQMAEKVLREKRGKLMATLHRVMRLYEKEDPDYYRTIKLLERQYYERKNQMSTFYESVRNVQKVQLHEIPLPDLPQTMGEVPLPYSDQTNIPTHSISILKKATNDLSLPSAPLTYESKGVEYIPDKDPPGPPPGPPPTLPSEDSDSDAEDDGNLEKKEKKKQIRFADTQKGDDKLVSALQVKMLKMAGQSIPKQPGQSFPPPSEALSTVTSNPSIPPPSLPLGVIPPGPPPGLPPAHILQAAAAVRARLMPPPPGPPPGLPPAARVTSLMGPPPIRPPPSRSNFISQQSSSVLSAPPSLIQRPTNPESATIEAKPQIKHKTADITKFVPTALRVKRDKGKGSAPGVIGPHRLSSDKHDRITGPSYSSEQQDNHHQGKQQTKDDVYEAFLREVQGLL